MTHYSGRPDKGFILVSVLFLTLLAMLAVVGVLSQVRNNLAFEGSSKRLMVRDYQNEVTLNKGIRWINNNSATFAALLNASDFYDIFERTTASSGGNDTLTTAIPTMIKLRDSTDSFILSNSNTVGVQSVPSGNPAATQLAASFGSTFGASEIIRITMIDAVTEQSSDDGGDPNSGGTGLTAAPYPLLRIDVFPKDQSVTNTYALVRGKPAS